jgi:adenylate cyclase
VEDHGRDAKQGAGSTKPNIVGEDHSSTLFISYASADAEVANSVVATLENHELKCWIAPRDVTAGALYAEAIVRAIGDARTLVLILSANSVGSAHVGREVERASSKRRPVIAFRVDDAPLSPALEYFLSESQWIDARADGINAAMGKLVAALREPERKAQQDVAIGTTGASHSTALAARSKSKHRMLFGVVSASAIAVTALLVGKFLLASHPPIEQTKTPATADLSDKSIAVLPFTDMSEKKDQEYFADGMSEDLLDLLSRVPELRVIARTSAFSFKGKNDDVRTIASKLGVSYLIEGSVRKSGSTLRITTQLIRATDGSHIWSQTYDRSADDIFKVQDDIAAAVVQSLKVSLAHAAMPTANGTSNSEAHSLVLQAEDMRQKAHRPEDAAKVEIYLQQALRLDAGNSAAWASLSRLRFLQANVGWPPPGWDAARTWDDARRAALKSIDLDPTNIRGRVALSQILFFHDWDWSGTEAQVEQIRAIDPNSDLAVFFSGFNAAMAGDANKAIDLTQKENNLNPLDYDSWRRLAYLYRISDRLDEAQSAIQRALDLNPSGFGIHAEAGFIQMSKGDLKAAMEEIDKEVDDEQKDVGHVIINFKLGRNDEANLELAKLETKYGAQNATDIADIHAFRHEDDAAFQWLTRAFNNHEQDLLYIKMDPFLKTLHSDPRFKSLLRRINLPE